MGPVNKDTGEIGDFFQWRKTTGEHIPDTVPTASLAKVKQLLGKHLHLNGSPAAVSDDFLESICPGLSQVTVKGIVDRLVSFLGCEAWKCHNHQYASLEIAQKVAKRIREEVEKEKEKEKDKDIYIDKERERGKEAIHTEGDKLHIDINTSIGFLPKINNNNNNNNTSKTKDLSSLSVSEVASLMDNLDFKRCKQNVLDEEINGSILKAAESIKDIEAFNLGLKNEIHMKGFLQKLNELKSDGVPLRLLISSEGNTTRFLPKINNNNNINSNNAKEIQISAETNNNNTKDLSSLSVSEVASLMDNINLSGCKRNVLEQEIDGFLLYSAENINDISALNLGFKNEMYIKGFLKKLNELKADGVPIRFLESK
jgi:hypothetical protein